MEKIMDRIIIMMASFFILISFSSFGYGAGSSDKSSSKRKTNLDLKQAKIFIKAENYQSAIKYLKKAVVNEPDNADIYNLLGYSYRKFGDRINGHLNYNKALELDPEHEGTLEYQGQLFLQEGNLDKAKENLKKLDDLCLFNCDEYESLKTAVENYGMNSDY
jgi:tetratricopeptide (TPR) repeat protein